MQISLVSWNVHGVLGAPRRAERMRLLAEKVGSLEPDLALLQEVWLARDAHTIATVLAPHYRNLPHDGEGWLFRDSGLMALIRADSGWDVRASDVTEFRAEAPDWRIWQADGFADKGVQRIALARQGVGFTVLNTHLQARYRAQKYTAVRERQLAELAEVARSAAEFGAVVCAGDLNTPVGGPLFARAIAPSWVDLSARLRTTCGCSTNFHDDGRPKNWIDYVLAWREARAPVALEKMELLANDGPDDPYSDHNGLHARLLVADSPRAAWHPPLAAATLAALLAQPERRWSRRGLLAAMLGSSVRPSIAPARGRFFR